MLKKQVTLLILLTLLTGCASNTRTTTYVLDQKEIVRTKKGETITTEFDGFLLSDRAVDRILNAKIKGVNLQ